MESDLTTDSRRYSPDNGTYLGAAQYYYAIYSVQLPNLWPDIRLSARLPPLNTQATRQLDEWTTTGAAVGLTASSHFPRFLDCCPTFQLLIIHAHHLATYNLIGWPQSPHGTLHDEKQGWRGNPPTCWLLTDLGTFLLHDTSTLLQLSP